MNDDYEPLRLKIPGMESAEDLGRRIEREQLLKQRRQENELEDIPLAPMRVGRSRRLSVTP